MYAFMHVVCLCVFLHVCRSMLSGPAAKMMAQQALMQVIATTLLQSYCSRRPMGGADGTLILSNRPYGQMG